MEAPPLSSVRDLAPALDALPIFPLPQTVLFPGALLPLHVFEPRYRAMVKDALGTHKAMAIALIREGHERDVHGHPSIETITGLGVIIDHVQLADGRYNILLHARRRVQLEELPFVPPCRRARHMLLHSTPTDTPARHATA